MYKIVFIANEYQTGGATKSLIGLSKTLREKFDIDPIILVNKTGYLTQMCEIYSIKYYKLNYKPFVIGAGNTPIRKLIKRCLIIPLKVRHFICNKIALLKAKKIFNKNDIKIIHTNTNRDDFGAILAKEYDIPHIWHLREFGTKDYECVFLRKNYIEYMNKNTTKFIAISKIIKRFFIEKGIEKNKIELIYNGVKINEKTIERKKCKKKIIKIIFLGGISESKGQYQIIEAISLLPEKIKTNIFVDFYGNGSQKYIRYLKEIIKKNNLEKNVRFNDYCNHIDEKINQYDVGVMCSRAEAFGRVTVEYMTNNLVTIASDTGANPELIKDGENGFLYKYNDIEDLKNTILNVYNLTETQKKILKKNAYVTSIKFSEQNNALNIYNLYKKVLK